MDRRALALELSTPEPLLIDETRRGMASNPRLLPAGISLDPAGHALYDRVSMTPGFGLVRAETRLLGTNREAILRRAGSPTTFIDLEAGTGKLVRPLLSRASQYVAVDRCRPVLDRTVWGLRASFPKLEVIPVYGEPLVGFREAEGLASPRLVLLLGSALGRLDPTECRLMLQRVRRSMLPSDRLLVGMDLAKPSERLRAAYDDRTGYTAFVQNALRRLNREVGTDFREPTWEPVVDVQVERGRVEIRLESRVDQAVNGGKTGLRWEFGAGEGMVAERAYKPTEGQFAASALSAGFKIDEVWRDPEWEFAEFLLVP